jgi:hypothetical protein
MVTIRSKNWRGARLVKNAIKNFFLTELKNVWNAGTGALKSRGITVKSYVSFVSVYLQKCAFFFEKFRYFLTYPRTLTTMCIVHSDILVASICRMHCNIVRTSKLHLQEPNPEKFGSSRHGISLQR